MLDDKLIAAHQWVVDVSEKKPGWWAEQTAWVYTVATIVARVLVWKGGWDAVMLFVGLIVGSGMVMGSRNEAVLKSLSQTSWIRMFFASFTIFSGTIWLLDFKSQSFLYFVSSCMMLSYYCFAACQPPRPRKRKEKPVLVKV